MGGSFAITNPLTAFTPKIRQGGRNAFTAEVGQILTATVTKKTDAVTSLCTADGFSFDAATDKLTGGEVGAELQFEVVKAGKNGVELKQIQRGQQEQMENVEARRTHTGLVSMLRQSGFAVTDSAATDKEERDRQLKAMEAASRIKRQMRYVTNNAGRSAMKELLASGVSLEKISIDVLSSVMHEIEAKPERQTTPDELDTMIKKYLAEHHIPVGDADEKKQLVTALAEQGLPATDRNVRSLDTVLLKIREIKTLNDDVIAKLLKEEKHLTVENIYLAKHTSAQFPAAERLTPESWQALEPEVTRVFAREGVAESPEAVDAAKLLVEREIPVTAENIDKVRFLRGLGESLDTQRILYQAAGRIKQDRVLADVSVYADSLPAVYESVMADIPFITASHLEYLLKREPEPTVRMCCEARRASGVNESAQVSEAGTAAHERLLEVRRKLTYEAANRLMAQNIDISEMKLDEAIASLDSLAADYTKNLRAMGAETTAANVAQMNELYTCLKEIDPAPAHVFAALLAKSIPFTIRAVHTAANGRSAADGQSAANAYEQFATAPSARYGDHFSKVREQLAPVLENNDILVTDDNLRAAETLTRNQLPVTPENVTEIRLIDWKLAEVQNRLHPNIAAAMLKERHNPLNMQIDEVLSYIDGFNDAYGEGVGDKLAEHIRKLDDTKTLTRDERDAMIAVYRTLNLIRRDQSVGLGLSLRYGGELTLGRLLTNAQNYQRLKHADNLDIAVDENFGEAVRADGGEPSVGSGPSAQENNIRRLLDNVSPKTLTECEFNSMMIDRFTERATPEALQRVFNTDGRSADVDGLLLEEALELMPPDEEVKDAARFDRMQTGLSAAEALSTGALARLQYGEVPPTVANMQAMHVLETVGLGKALLELEKRLADEHDEPETLAVPADDLTALADPDAALEAIAEQLEDAKPGARSLLDELILVQNAVQVQQRINRREPQVTLPVRLHGGIADLNLYVVDKDAEQRDTVVLALDTPKLGSVRVFARRSGTDVRLEIAAEDPRAAAALKRNAETLRGYLSEAGFGPELVFPEAGEQAAVNQIAPTALGTFEFML